MTDWTILSGPETEESGYVLDRYVVAAYIATPVVWSDVAQAVDTWVEV